MFTLTPEQVTKLDDWIKTKPISKAAMGEQFTYCFTPTSLGVIVVVKCGITKTEIDLTNYEEW